jgi:putative Mg2+ transporter-C (MgtC) family protein
LTLGTLSAFRWIEGKMPSQQYAKFIVRFNREAAMSEPELKSLVTSHAFTIANLQYRLRDDGKQLEYSMMLRTQYAAALHELSKALLSIPTVSEFTIYPTGD